MCIRDRAQCPGRRGCRQGVENIVVAVDVELYAGVFLAADHHVEYRPAVHPVSYTHLDVYKRQVQNMLRLISDKAQALSERVDVLSRRSIREKLLCYFNQLAEKEGSRTFQLPFSLSMLADYIATDRSAMMRELKRLKEEGVLRSEGRRITLCTG